jgi:hypothetical protein
MAPKKSKGSKKRNARKQSMAPSAAKQPMKRKSSPKAPAPKARKASNPRGRSTFEVKDTVVELLIERLKRCDTEHDGKPLCMKCFAAFKEVTIDVADPADPGRLDHTLRHLHMMLFPDEHVGELPYQLLTAAVSPYVIEQLCVIMKMLWQTSVNDEQVVPEAGWKSRLGLDFPSTLLCKKATEIGMKKNGPSPASLRQKQASVNAVQVCVKSLHFRIAHCLLTVVLLLGCASGAVGCASFSVVVCPQMDILTSCFCCRLHLR